MAFRGSVKPKQAFAEKLPMGATLLRQKAGETIFSFNKTKNGNYFVLGFGYPTKIEIGNEFDIVYMNFGKNEKKIVVENNIARRQIYTLKIGHPAWVYGLYATYKQYLGEKNWDISVIIYAKAFQGWFVPTAFDRKHSDTETVEMSSEDLDFGIDVLSQLEKNE